MIDDIVTTFITQVTGAAERFEALAQEPLTLTRINAVHALDRALDTTPFNPDALTPRRRTRVNAALDSMIEARAALDAKFSAESTTVVLEVVLAQRAWDQVRRANRAMTQEQRTRWTNAVADGRRRECSGNQRVVVALNETLDALVAKSHREQWALITVSSSHNGGLSRGAGDVLDLVLDLFSVVPGGGIRLLLVPMAIRDYLRDERISFLRFARVDHDPRLKETLATLWSTSFDEHFSDLKQLAGVAHGLL